MLYTVCKHIKNFFPVERKEGLYSIVGGSIDLPLLNGQYFLIEGSILNDGVYQYPANNLMDETFKGEIVGMAVPKEFLKLVEEIEKYEEKASKSEGYISESFGGYSYTKATDARGNAASWQSAFSTRLNAWRKL